MMLLSNSAAGNAGVDRSFDMTPTPVLHVVGDRTKDAVTSLVQGSKRGCQHSKGAPNANDPLSASFIESNVGAMPGSE